MPGPNGSKFINPALESIEFQTGQVFFKELTAAFEELRKNKSKDLADDPAVLVLQKVINHHTGLDVQMSFGVIGPHVQVPNVNKNHPLVVDIHRNMTNSGTGLSIIEHADGAARGSVNLQTGKVSGIYTKIPHVIEFPIGYVQGKQFTSEECAAITLHELGHLNTYYEYMTSALTTNQALAGLSRSWEGNQTLVEREAVLLSVHKALNLKTDGIKELAKSSNKKVVEAVVLSQVMQKSQSEMGSNIYDMTSWEYLSDQYAARQGAGRHLVTALDKVMNSVFTPSFRSTPVFLAIEAFKILTTFSALLTFNPFPLIGVMLVTQPGKDTYDKPEARFLRIRNQIVENQKQKDLSPADRDRLSSDLATIDAIVKHVNDRRDFFTVLWHVFSKDYRNQFRSEQLQKDLELIAANDLFDKANQLKDLV
jgi:hypothetical protein